MFRVMVFEKDGEDFSLSFDKTEVNVGRVPGNDVVLAKGNVSKQHCRIVFKDHHFVLLDLHSTNGTYVNGRRVLATTPQEINPDDKIYVGEYILSIATDLDLGAPTPDAFSSQPDDAYAMPADNQSPAPADMNYQHRQGVGTGWPPTRPGIPTANPPISQFSASLPAQPGPGPMPMPPGGSRIMDPARSDNYAPVVEPAPPSAPPPPPSQAYVSSRSSRVSSRLSSTAIIAPNPPASSPGTPAVAPFGASKTTDANHPPEYASCAESAMPNASEQNWPSSAYSRPSNAAISSSVAPANQSPPPASVLIPAAAPVAPISTAPSGLGTGQASVPGQSSPSSPSVSPPQPMPVSPPSIPAAQEVSFTPETAPAPPTASPSIKTSAELQPGASPTLSALELGSPRVVEAHRPSQAQLKRYSAIQKEIRDRLVGYLDFSRPDSDNEEQWNHTEKSIREIINQLVSGGKIDQEIDQQQLLTDVLYESLGLGPLEPLLADDEVSEILVNHATQIYVERQGKISLLESTFSSNQALLVIIKRLLKTIDRELDESQPYVEARLRDGSSFHAVLLPPSVQGPCFTIRKRNKKVLGINELMGLQALSPAMAEFLEICVKARRNIVISGRAGTGKTTMLNAIASYIPADERVICVEETGELQLTHENCVQLQVGSGPASLESMVKNCQQMRPDRILVGECGAGELFQLIYAMNAGQDGSLTTLCAGSPHRAVSRMETMVISGESELSPSSAQALVASTMHIVVQLARLGDGSRKITRITEITPSKDGMASLNDVFAFKQEGVDEQHRVLGKFVSTGHLPKFCQELKNNGIAVNTEIFRKP